MKKLLAILIILLAALQYRIWFGEGSLAHAARLEREIIVQRDVNMKLLDRNRALDVEVQELKTGLDTIEERARNDIGLIKNDETFFMIMEESN